MTREKASNPQERNISAAIATIAYSLPDGTPTTLEVDGVLYERAHDQAKARQSLKESQVWDKIGAYGVPGDLISEADQQVASSILDSWSENMRAIGHMLVFHGQRDLWQLAYLEYNQGSCYALGDETLFLSELPTSGQTGYKGPPTNRYNSAIEQAAQLAQRNG
jgi:hypothetical protein